MHHVFILVPSTSEILTCTWLPVQVSCRCLQSCRPKCSGLFSYGTVWTAGHSHLHSLQTIINDLRHTQGVNTQSVQQLSVISYPTSSYTSYSPTYTCLLLEVKVRAQDTNVVSQHAKAQSIYCVFHCVGTAPKLWSLLPYSGHERTDSRGLEPKRNWYVQSEEKEEQEIYMVQQQHLMQPWFHTCIFSSILLLLKTWAFQLPLPILHIKD